MKKFKVLYQSRKGNTKKIAEAIAQSLNISVEDIPPAYPPENDILIFLGGGFYMGKIDNKMRDFIETLNPNRVKNVAVFGTTGGDQSGIAQMKELLKKQGINVIDESFVCKGKSFFFINRKHPDDKDIQEAKAFAKRVMNQFKTV